MHRLEGAVRSYAWGSRTAIADLCGRPVPAPHPEAELWFGAHPADPAQLLTGGRSQSLLTVIDNDPDRELGEVATQFGGRLPFLLKVLAAAEPLSLQAHPSEPQAVAGYRRESRLQVPMNSPERNYRDDNHKPELVVALERFEALAGFHDPAETSRLLFSLDVLELHPYADLIAQQPDSSGLRALFTTWITMPAPTLRELLPRVVDGCRRYLESGATEFAPQALTVMELAGSYPGDAGVLAALLLNRVTLEPGQGLFLPAGNLHAYLRGTAVEIMANSDNVLRGGLTPKHIDVPELLRVLDFTPVLDPVIRPVADGPCVLRYPTPATEFALRRADLTPREPVTLSTPGGPTIILCVAGAAELRCGTDTVPLDRGSAAWIAAADPAVTAEATTAGATLFTASVGGAHTAAQ